MRTAVVFKSGKLSIFILPPENEWEVFNNTEQTLKEYNNSIIKKFLKKYNNDVTLVSKKLDIFFTDDFIFYSLVWGCSYERV